MTGCKSNKQRKSEIKAHRRKREVKARSANAANARLTPPGAAPCEPSLLKPYNSYGVPPFVMRGYYLDTEFTCKDCGKAEIWKAAQQKWWYETAHGNVESRAARCRACRRIERERKALARTIHQQGLSKKHTIQSAHAGDDQRCGLMRRRFKRIIVDDPLKSFFYG